MEKIITEIPTIYRYNDAFDFLMEYIDNSCEVIGGANMEKYTEKLESWLISLVRNCDKKIPSKTYYATRKSDDKIIGIVTYNFRSTKRIRERRGDVSFSIRPLERNKGYSKGLIYATIKECICDKMEELFIACEKEDTASIKSITSVGGILFREYYDKRKEKNMCVYKINTKETVEKYKDIYE